MSAPHYGDFPTSATVYMVFDSFAATTGASSATSNFVAGDVVIFKDGSTTQRTSSAGITATTSFDTNTGLNMVAIDTSDNTDAGFYAAGHEYQVAVADVTIDTQTVRFWLGTFSIERANGILALIKARTPNAAAGASGGLLISGSNSGTTTLAALTVTGTLTVSDGIAVSRSSANTSAVTFTGNGTGHGFSITSGSGATGNGINVTSSATNGNGVNAAGAGTGDAIKATGGATGNALELIGGGTSGDGMKVTTTSGHGINLAPVGTSKHGFFATGGNGGTSDGMSLVAGTGGVALRAANLATSTDITNAVWDEARASHTTAGSFGQGVASVQGNVTGSVASVTGNVGGNVTGSVGSVATGGIAAASFAAGAIDAAAIAANAIGASEIADGAIDAATFAASAIDSTAIAAGAITSAKFAAGAIDATAIAADAIGSSELASTAANEIADAILARNVSGGSSAGRTVSQALHILRNKRAIAAGTLTVYDTDDSTTSWTASVSTTAGNPIDSIDPA